MKCTFAMTVGRRIHLESELKGKIIWDLALLFYLDFIHGAVAAQLSCSYCLRKANKLCQSLVVRFFVAQLMA